MDLLMATSKALWEKKPHPPCTLCNTHEGYLITCAFIANDFNPHTATQEQIDKHVDWIWFCVPCLQEHGGPSGCADYYEYKQGLH